MHAVCVTGGSGFIGKRLVERLCASGKTIHLLTRKNLIDVQQRRYFVADLADENTSLVRLLDGVDVIYHCAGETKNTSLMRALHVGGTLRLLAAVRLQIEKTRKPIHWVQLSSVGAYGPPLGAAHDERVVLESTPLWPIGEYEVTKTLADEFVQQFGKAEPLFSYSILRPSNVIGPEMSNQSVRALVLMIRKQFFFYIGSRSAVATYVHVEDVVAALILCGSHLNARRQVFNLSNDCALAEIVEAVALAYGLRPPSLCLPEIPLRFLVKSLSKIKSLPLTQERIDALVKKTHYPNIKIAEYLGFLCESSIPSSIANLFAKSR